MVTSDILVGKDPIILDERVLCVAECVPLHVKLAFFFLEVLNLTTIEQKSFIRGP